MTEQSGHDKMMQPVDLESLESLVLGETDTLLGFQSRDQLIALIAAMIGQAKFGVRYFGQQFDPAVMGSGDVSASIQGLLTRSRETTFQSLVSYSQPLVQSGSRLVELLRSNMPRVECRMRKQSNSSHGTFSGSFILVDEQGYVYLPDPQRFAGSASFYNAGTVSKFDEVFKESWRVADLDSEMQSLLI